MEEFKTLQLRHMPPDIYRLIIAEQAKIRASEGKKISLERVIYRFLREKK
jgi:hypothetical protein